ncbi:hypothetical protein Tco_1437752 [Tanacetum coccineum]
MAYSSSDTVTKPLTKKLTWQNQTTTSLLPKRISSLMTTEEECRRNAVVEIQGENAYEHINKFLDVVGSIKINGLTQDRFWLSIFPVSLTGAAHEWFTRECMGSITTWDNMIEKFIKKFHHLSDHNDDEDIKEEEDPNETNNAPKIFMIEGNLFDFETPLYEAFSEFNCLLKIDINLFTYDIQDLKTYNKYEQKLIMTKQSTDSRGLKKGTSKLQECWWKVNAHEIAPFTRMENFGRGPYANMKTEWVSNPYLGTNRIFGRDYEASNVSCTQENQNDNRIPEPSNYKVRRFEMMKYSFNDEEEYITIKESEYLNHLKDSFDAVSRT